MNTNLQFIYIKINRYLLKRKFFRIMSGPLKGMKWAIHMNYEYLTGSYLGDDEKKVILKYLDKAGAVFYDIGANVGYYSACVAKMLPACKVIAFEPIPQHIATLKEHISINKITGIELQQAAVTDTSRELLFSNRQNSEGNTYKNESDLFKNANDTLKVKGISVDDFVAAGHPAPSLLKIDVEGAEMDALRGSINTIKMHRPVIMLATHDFHVPGIKEQCLQFFADCDYTAVIVGAHNKYVIGLEDFLAVPNERVS